MSFVEDVDKKASINAIDTGLTMFAAEQYQIVSTVKDFSIDNLVGNHHSSNEAHPDSKQLNQFLDLKNGVSTKKTCKSYVIPNNPLDLQVMHKPNQRAPFTYFEYISTHDKLNIDYVKKSSTVVNRERQEIDKLIKTLC